ncbi:hypothetical protein COCSADRAFT_253375 [Bipolaris sorokiniana ND90Pr]|uniref:DNA recombination and repair protein Rad51-like C-terminal domain-containing protein n=1 Tax=Cochliobolus sativus (strain ND90Pr / ATCC 201652) TaxID=665912 RepID=M2QXE7_COCSN|nr:uncharacterized protein COCSADRAFT_253375 [Bipolaris sorokiniana ND90Pr]EMD59739.1 hypothetical protein COCSADRAFT_253375 [Bipolaris sorokiniana ND90Pr]
MAAESVASDDEHNDDSFIVDIDAIQAHGIGAVDISKLKSNGYYTIASVHSATRRNLLKIKGFSEVKVDKVKDAIAKCQVSCAGAVVSELALLKKNICSLQVEASRLLMSLDNSESASSRFLLVAKRSTRFSEVAFRQ